MLEEYIYIIKMFGTNIEAYKTEKEAKARVAELRAFQTLLMQTAAKGQDENFEVINSFYDENICICVDKVLIKGEE